MIALEPQDFAQNIYDLNLDKDQLVHRSVGLRWNLSNDMFEFDISANANSLTRGRVLSTVNSLFDPLGFLSPVVICGKLILRDVVSENSNWDEPLLEHIMTSWETQSSTSKALEDIHIPRVIVPDLSMSVRNEL